MLLAVRALVSHDPRTAVCETPACRAARRSVTRPRVLCLFLGWVDQVFEIEHLSVFLFAI